MRKIMMKQSESYTISDSFDVFIKNCTVRNLSPKTIKTYKKCFHSFIKYLDPGTPIQTVTSTTVDNYILYLKEHSSCNDITVNSYLRTIRSWLYWAMNNGQLSRFSIRMIKADKTIKETYNEHELKLLLAKPNTKKCTFTEYKTWVLSNFLLGTGMRISSALNIQIKDIDLDGMMITMRKSKNRKSQFIPISKSLAEVMQEYLVYRDGKPDDYFFCNIYGNKGNQDTFYDNLAHYNQSRVLLKHLLICIVTPSPKTGF